MYCDARATKHKPITNLLQNGRNALHLASSAGHADVVAALILAGCDVNVSDSVSIFLAIHLRDEGTPVNNANVFGRLQLT
jgi:ankyrin repeat protein